jgi:hypothetical protein
MGHRLKPSAFSLKLESWATMVLVHEIDTKSSVIYEKSGLVDPSASYNVQLENVTNMDNLDLKTMVDGGRYFSIFAPRQSGKTTFFKGFCLELKKIFIFINEFEDIA